MEILTLILLYYLSQNPDFAESVKPIMEKLKNSENMLRFLNDLSRFSGTFSGSKPEGEKAPPPPPDSPPPPPPDPPGQKETPASPTSGIADAFIQDCLDRYFKKH